MACNQPTLIALEQRVGMQLPRVRTWAIEAEAEPLLTLTFGTRWPVTIPTCGIYVLDMVVKSEIIR
jgi:hypothetical protein